jgi:hypothetical protein
LIVIDVLIWSMRMPSKRTAMSSRVLIGTPTLPISGAASGWSAL